MSRSRRHPLVIAGTAAGLVLLGSTGPAQATPAPTSAVSVSAHRTLTPVPLPNGFRPEGVTSGPGDTYYTGSLADGRIWTGDLSRGTGRLLLAGVEGRALRGMQWD